MYMCIEGSTPKGRRKSKEVRVSLPYTAVSKQASVCWSLVHKDKSLGGEAREVSMGGDWGLDWIIDHILWDHGKDWI